MKLLYITSVERYSGKTATCLALGLRFQEMGYAVGYLKPLSLQPWRVGNQIADEDAAFVIEALGLKAEPWDLSPVVLTPEYLEAHLESGSGSDFLKLVRESCTQASHGKDILLLEGGGSLREGYVVGLPTPAVAEELGALVLAIVKYRDNIRVLDDALAAQKRLGPALLGIIINRVPEPADDFVKSMAAPYLEKRGIPVMGVLPEVRRLASLSLAEIINLLKPEILTPVYDPDALVENLTVGAMTAEAALSRFRKQTNKAVITGGDRTDIQLAALETSTTCLILTGNLRPSPMVVKQAEELGIAVLLVRPPTMETIEKIERVLGKTRLGLTTKLETFRSLIKAHVDIERLTRALGLQVGNG